MSQFVISGGKKLSGELTVYGNKNAVLPIMAASLLVEGETCLYNVPMIKDVLVMADILIKLGVEVAFQNDHRLLLKTKGVHLAKIDPHLARKLRASVLLIGPLISRFGKAEIVHPGGDIIGKRSIETHLHAFAKLGVKTIKKADSYIFCLQNKVKKAEIFLPEPSVTATENILIASSLGGKTVILENAAMEPHVVNLCSFLIKSGAKISGLGTNKLKIYGQKKLNGVTHRIVTDHVEIGTFAIIAALCGEEVRIHPVTADHLKMILHVFAEMGIKFKLNNDSLHIYSSRIKTRQTKVQAGPWPMFPTDLMSPFIVLATQAAGQTLFHDPMYESRMFFVDKLMRMGAHITICDPHRVIVNGPTKLSGGHLNTPDIRAGIALVIAALVADGESIIDNIEIIERGYEDLAGRLSALGANIVKHE